MERMTAASVKANETDQQAKLITFDLAQTPLREVNHYLHHGLSGEQQTIRILNPDGIHNIAVGLDAPVEVEIMGHAGYYAAGMNKQAKTKK